MPGENRKDYSPDKDLYIKTESMGMIFTLAAFFEDELIGYICFVISKNGFHSRKKRATCCDWFLKKEHRQGLTGVKLVFESEKQLMADGVEEVIIGAMDHLRDAANILQKIGYEKRESLYAKKIRQELKECLTSV